MRQEKINQAVAIINELSIDLWMIIEKESEVLSGPISDYILSTGVTWLSFFLFFKNGKKVAIIGNLDIEKFKRLKLFDEIYTYKNSPKKNLVTILDKFNPRKIAINYSINSPAADGLTYGRFLSLQKLLKNTNYLKRFISAEDIISRLRGRKSIEEVKRIKQAIEITLEIYDGVTSFAKPGKTEIEVADYIKNRRKALGLEPSWEEEHNPSVFSGPQTTGAHSSPTSNKLKRGHVFNIDAGVKVKQYCSDLQRTWYILKDNEKEPPAEVMKGFNTIKESIRLAFKILKPGVKGVEVDTIARKYIISQGYEEFPHALGHQVGRNAHDGGALLGPIWERYGNLPLLPLEKDQVFTIEPRLYLKDYGVVTIEEMVLITAAGAKWLSKPQENIFIIK